MLTDIKSEFVASKTTEEATDPFDEVKWRQKLVTKLLKIVNDIVLPTDDLNHLIQSFGDDFSDEPNESPFDSLKEMENVETEDTESDPFFDSGFYNSRIWLDKGLSKI